MGLVGGSTVPFMSIIFPCFFYMYLSASEQKLNENKFYNDGSMMSSNDADSILPFMEYFFF